ncbi:hypothetical protein BJ970_007183 [Saccharopolyspora phatthalungensis]|uniref:Uncharacterized protein n=1 Tax=Saccharopolyspora phatthalungensis TaxID=664693 RepID=A0A840QFH5_9PSEU|nr:hypothetical protein [Saccharopolyspora phatthalungensis]
MPTRRERSAGIYSMTHIGVRSDVGMACRSGESGDTAMT